MSFVTHISDLAYGFFILIGPVPVCLLLVMWAESGRAISVSRIMLSFLVWWCATQCFIGIALGAIGWLHLNVLLGLELVIGALGVAALWKHRRGTLALAARGLEKMRVTCGDSHVALLTLLVVFGCSLMWHAMISPVEDYDSLAYHLPQIAEWYQKGSLAFLPGIGLQIARYPFTWEILGSFFVIPFGEDTFIGMANLCAWFVLGVAIYRLATRLGASAIVAMSSAILCMTIPSITFQLGAALIDLAVAAFFLSSLCLMLEYRRGGSQRVLLTLLASASVLLGIKASSLVYFGVLVLVFLARTRAWSGRGPKATPIQGNGLTMWTIVATVPPLLFLACFWYARNLIQLGNPLGHLYANPASTTLASIFDIGSLQDWGVLWTQVYTKLSVPFLTLLLLFPLFPWALWRDSASKKRQALLLITGLVLVNVLLYWVTPYSGDNGTQGGRITAWIGGGFRYAFPAVGALAVAGALIATSIQLPAWLLISIVIVSVVMQIVQATGLTQLGQLFLIFVLLMGAWRSRRLWTPICSPLVIASLIGLSAALIITQSYSARMQRDKNREVVYGRAQTMIENLVPSGGRIGYLLSQQPYMFYGSRLDRHLLFVPAGHKGKEEWVRELHRQDIQLLAAGPLRNSMTSRKEIVWLSEENGALQRIYGPDKGIVLFRLRD